MTSKKDGFIWGVATSAGQIEGASLQDGRTASIWDTYSKIPGNIQDNYTPDIACDSYHNISQDIKMLAYLGVDSYRFSTSWSRVLPNGVGEINQKGLDYYKRLVEELLANNIQPNMTLYHWDLPQSLQDKNGFLNRDLENWFAEYSEVMYKNFGDIVPFFTTFNEPIATYVGYGLGVFAPGLKGEKSGRIANHNLLLAHGKSVEVFRSHNFKESKIGIVVDVWNREPLDKDSEEDVALCKIENEKAHLSYLNPLFCGEYSGALMKYFDDYDCFPTICDGDMKNIAQPLDFFGLNCYSRITVSHLEQKNMEKQIKLKGGNFLNNSQEFYPASVYENTKMLREKFGLTLPIYITENGCYAEAEAPQDGIIQDDYRITYLQGFVDEINRANRDGLDIRGYYHWSLMDNFEWTAGYNFKFGLHTIDRKPKKSASYYKELIAANKG